MSATTTNILRYSALAMGVLYGFSHQRSITSAQRAEAAKREYEHKQSLITQAKDAYAKSKPPASAAATSATTGLDQDPMGANFSLEAFFDGLVKQKP